MRSLVLNVDVGAGHKSAAAALCAALAELRPGSEHRMVETLGYLGPEVGELGKQLYLGVQKTVPDLFGLVYEQRSLFNWLRPLGEFADELRIGQLGREAAAYAPDLVIATHPIACGLGAALRRTGKVQAPLVAVVTDFDGHPAWVQNGIDLYLVGSEAVAADLAANGAARSALAVTGIPLRGAFAQTPAREEARARVGLGRQNLAVLLLGGGLGLGPIVETLAAVDELDGPLEFVVIAGSNRELAEAARAQAQRSRHPVRVEGYTEQMADFMAAVEIAIGKPGGITSAELLALGVPLVALRPLAGQEEANCAWLVEQGVALRADSARQAREALQSLLCDPHRLLRMRSAALGLGRPRAARAAAHRIVELLGGEY
jgi:processive 1,2-diacylglycerol beta-glucosyltransferase